VRQVRAHVTLHISQRFERMVCRECGGDAPCGTAIQHFIGCNIGAYARCLDGIGELPAEVEDLKRPRSFTRAQERDLSALIFEARSLARSIMVTHLPGAELCGECLQAVTGDSLVGHTAECRAGRVFRRVAQLCAESATRPTRADAFAAAVGAALVTYGEPWTVEGNSADDWPVRLRDRHGRLVLELRDSEVGDAVEEAFMRRVALAINFLSNMPDKSLAEVVDEYGQGNYWIAAVPRSIAGEALLATVKRIVAANVPRPSSQLFTEGTYPGAAFEAGPEGPVEVGPRDRHWEPTAHLSKGEGATEAGAPSLTISQAPLSSGDAAADPDRGVGTSTGHGSAAAEISPACQEGDHRMCAGPYIHAVGTPGQRGAWCACDCHSAVQQIDPGAHLGAAEDADGQVVGLHALDRNCTSGHHAHCNNTFCQCPCHEPAAERAA
jgi:hypothetical protein